MKFPAMCRVRQVFDVPQLENVEETLRSELEAIQAAGRIRAGARIAVTAGSRGIHDIVPILRQAVAFLKAQGADPFLIPAMGSHGGGTAPGQIAILESLGITESTVGVPIQASMEVVEIGRSKLGLPVFVDKQAAQADGIVVINRVKAHTEFEGAVESGLMKMMVIGMGKHRGCQEVHKQTVNFGYGNIIPETGRVILAKLPVLFGVAIVENTYDRTAFIRALPPERFEETESALLVTAKRLMARLPFDRLDVLVVDEMGKNVSGTGMDTNVIGRIMFVAEPEPESPKILRIVVLDLTPEAHGNAIGIGLADYTTRRLADKVDAHATAINAIAASVPEKSRIPIALETDRLAVEAALNTIGVVEPEAARLVHIRNTLELGELDVSHALLEEVRNNPTLEIVGDRGLLSFDDQGHLAALAFPDAVPGTSV